MQTTKQTYLIIFGNHIYCGNTKGATYQGREHNYMNSLAGKGTESNKKWIKYARIYLKNEASYMPNEKLNTIETGKRAFESLLYSRHGKINQPLIMMRVAKEEVLKKGYTLEQIIVNSGVCDMNDNANGEMKLLNKTLNAMTSDDDRERWMKHYSESLTLHGKIKRIVETIDLNIKLKNIKHLEYFVGNDPQEILDSRTDTDPDNEDIIAETPEFHVQAHTSIVFVPGRKKEQDKDAKKTKSTGLIFARPNPKKEDYDRAMGLFPESILQGRYDDIDLVEKERNKKEEEITQLEQERENYEERINRYKKAIQGHEETIGDMHEQLESLVTEFDKPRPPPKLYAKEAKSSYPAEAKSSYPALPRLTESEEPTAPDDNLPKFQGWFNVDPTTIAPATPVPQPALTLSPAPAVQQDIQGRPPRGVEHIHEIRKKKPTK